MNQKLAVFAVVLALLLGALWAWTEFYWMPRHGPITAASGETLRWVRCPEVALRRVPLPMRCARLRFEDLRLGEVSLPLVIIGDHPDRAAVLHLPGGPGGSAWLDPDGLGFWQMWWHELGAGRDLILFDPRGTGLAHPKPRCPALEALPLEGLDQPLGADDLARRESAAVDACLAVGEDLRLDAYSTVANRDDLDRLARMLIQVRGYPGIHLHGISYGTRLALETMRETPPWLLTAVLDGVYPPDVDPLRELGESMQLLLGRIDTVCAASESCRRRFGDGRVPVLELAARLEAEPRLRRWRDAEGVERAVLLTGTRLLAALFMEAYSNALLPGLPLMLAQALDGVEDALDPLLWDYLGALADDSLNPLVLAAVECQDSPHLTAADWAALRARWPQYALALPEFFDETLCQRLGLRPAPRAAVRSTLPTLLFSSAIDPVTPAAWGERARAGLAQSEHFIVPDAAHGLTLADRCAGQLMRALWDEAALPPAKPCEEDWGPVTPLEVPEDIEALREFMIRALELEPLP